MNATFTTMNKPVLLGVTTIFAIAPGQMQNKSNISTNPVSLNALA